MESLDNLFLKELTKRKERFKNQRMKSSWFVSSIKLDTTFQVIYKEQENKIYIFQQMKKAKEIQNEEEAAQFLEKITKEEDMILEKKEEILNWVRKMHHEAFFDGNQLYLKPGIYHFYLGKHTFLEDKYYAFFEEEHFVGDKFDEVFQWAFQKVKKPIQLKRVKNIFKNEA